MITADKITKLAYLSTIQLEAAIQKNYPQDRFTTSRFLGITNGGQFCYEVRYFDLIEGEDCFTKVFVDLDCRDQPVAEY